MTLPRAAPQPPPELLTVGRVNLDLYSEQPGRPMSGAVTFRAMVGGSPTNVAIAAQRLGLPSAVLTAVGQDPAGDLVLRQLAETGVSTRWVHRLPTGSTSMALLATIEPDLGERQFYRDNASDTHLSPEMADDLPWESLRTVLLSADALARGSTSDVADAISGQAREQGIPVWWDLDLRESNWPDLDAYSSRVRGSLAGADVVLGTQAEYQALCGLRTLDAAAIRHLGDQLDVSTLIVKTGASGAALVDENGQQTQVPAASLAPLVCTVGSGDSVAGGLLRALRAGMSWEAALQFAMKVASWTAGQPGCSQGFPTLDDLGVPLPELSPATPAGRSYEEKLLS